MLFWPINTALNVPMLFVQSSDHITGATGLTLVMSISQDAGAFATFSPTVTERTLGFYQISLTATHTNTAGVLTLHGAPTTTTADPSDYQILIVNPTQVFIGANAVTWAGASTATTNIALSTVINVTQWAGFSAATTQVAVATMAPANAIQWAGLNTSTTQLAVQATTVLPSSATNVNVVSWAGFNTATNQIAVATTPLSVNTTQWAGFNTATTQLAIYATTALSNTATDINVVGWAGFAAATTQVAVATMAPANTIQWAGASTATTQQALATFVNVNQWAGFNTATTQLAVATGVTANLTSTAVTSIWNNVLQISASGQSVTAADSLRLANAANAGILAGATTANVTIQNLANTFVAINATVDGVGNRTVVGINTASS